MSISSSAKQGSLESLGRNIFFDNQLSNPAGQSCATCHQPNSAFSSSEAVNHGANPQKATNRNAPSLSYVSHTPSFNFRNIEGQVVPVGGMFWDGRVDGLKGQSIEPFINPLEMGNESMNAVAAKLRDSSYFQQWQKTTGRNIQSNNEIIDIVSQALTAFQISSDFNKFNSKYDLWLQNKANLTTLEAHGLLVFERIDKGNCAACHTLKKQYAADYPLFTDFTYDNIGIPANKENPFYQNPLSINPFGDQFIDYGLGNSQRMKDQRYLGMFKVPTLRNVELTAPYMHNGVFKTLREVVEFYNTRDIDPRWEKPEVSFNVNDTELGDLKLTELEVDALIAFMKTLTDDYEISEN